MTGSNNDTVIPIWPEKGFAELFLIYERASYHLVTYEIRDFMDRLKKLEVKKIELAGFPNTELDAVHISAFDMKNHLLFELSPYE
jgi:hypothetical protein